MCGISGIFSPRKKIDPGIISSMTNQLNHRGPDDEGYFRNEYYHCGHKRLKIIDLETGQQPMKSNNGRYVLVYNGELYNYKELRLKLERDNVTFSSESDTEVLLKMYEKYGRKCLSFFNGMYAFAVCDLREETIFIARDRVGIKPLYYYNKDGVFIFGSELKSLLKYPNIDKTLDQNFINEYFTWRHSITDITPFNYIKKFPAASWCTIDKNCNMNFQKYWKIDRTYSSSLNDEQIYEKMEEVLNKSISYRMLSDVPMGVFLSGGLDSSTIAYFMAEKSSKPINTFTVGFNAGKKYDEINYGKQISDLIGSNHSEIIVEPSSLDILEQIIYYLDEPLGDPAVIPTYLMAKQAKKEITVVLSGEGSDEVNGGYGKYLKYFMFNEHPYTKKLQSLYKVPFLQSDVGEMIRKTTFSPERYNNSYMPFQNDIKKLIKQPKLYEESNSYFQLSKELMVLDFNTWLKNDLLVKVDRMTMAHALEARVPYLDHNYIELMYGIPSSKKFKSFKTKALLRRLMSKKIPYNILNRRQHGFNVPLEKWFQNNIFMESEYLNESYINNQGIFHWPYIKMLQKAHLTKKADNSIHLWMVIVFQRWLDQFC